MTASPAKRWPGKSGVRLANRGEPVVSLEKRKVVREPDRLLDRCARRATWQLRWRSHLTPGFVDQHRNSRCQLCWRQPFPQPGAKCLCCDEVHLGVEARE